MGHPARLRRSGRVLLVAALLAASFVIASGGSAARGPGSIAESADSRGVKYRDLRGDTSRVSVVVKMAGAPVAAIQAAAPGRQLSPARAREIAAEIDRRQAPALGALNRLGARIVARYRVAYNGFAVSIRRDRLDELAKLPGVVAIKPVRIVERNHQNSMPFMKVPPTWGTDTPTGGFRGEGKTVAVIDSGFDYTHANFGGPGERAIFDVADAADTAPPLLIHYDPNKYKGGHDFVGDNYDSVPDAPGETATPAPDPNPLDCRENGHGSHVAGSVAGFGVVPNLLDIGFLTTYNGPYDSTLTREKLLADFKIAPGVAPRAGIFALRVFGCNGSSTDAIVGAAIERALDPNGDGNTADKVDVINMSLGSPFGGTDEIAAVASTNAVRVGTVVAASAGNSGPAAYIVGSPSIATGAISVAANDPIPSFPSATAAMTKADATSGGSITMINANNEPLPSGALRIVVAKDPTRPGGVSLGCSQANYPPRLPIDEPAVIVTQRGVCARVSRALRAEKAGYKAAIMINNSSAFPPFEGKITSDPDTGELPLNGSRVLIPLLGTRGCLTACAGDTADPETLVAADGGTMTLTAGVITNPAFKAFASFTSGGPRPNDSWLKPDVTGPGVSILSTDAGMGNEATSGGGAIVSGTSMSSPHVAGLAALVRQARPSYTAEEVKAAIVNTALPSEVADYSVRRGGSGFAQADRATGSTVTAHGDELTATLNFAFNEIAVPELRLSKTITLRNHGTAAVTFNVSEERKTGVQHAVFWAPGSVTVPAGGTATVRVTLVLPSETAGNSAAFREAGGLILLTPTGGGNSGIALRVPYYTVPRALSNIRTSLASALTPDTPSTTASVSNAGGVMTGTGDFFAWGINDAAEGNVGRADIRAVGVQSFPEPLAGSSPDPDRRGVYFAINSWKRWSSASITSFEIPVDVDNDGANDYRVVAADTGLLVAGAFDGTYAALVFNERCINDPVAECFDIGGFLASAPTDSSTLILRTRTDLYCDPDGSLSNPDGTPVPAHAAPCMSKAENPRFTYSVEGIDLFGVITDDPAAAVPPDETEVSKFNVWDSSITQGPCVGCTPPTTVGQAPASRFSPGLPPGGSGTVDVAVNATEWAQTPQLGLMVVSLDNRAGEEEAQLLAVAFQNPVSPPAAPPPAAPPVVQPPPITTPQPPPVTRRPRAAARCVVPRTRGMTLPRARRAIRRNRCTVGRVSQAYSRKVAKGRVIAQSPRAGVRRPLNARVALVLSRGAPPAVKTRVRVRPPFTG